MKFTFTSVMSLLKKIARALLNRNIWIGYNILLPILIIDEVNVLNRLGYSLVAGEAYDFLIHIYCLDLHNLHVTTYVIGDLSKEEAEEYFEKHILSQNECKEFEGKFDHICKIISTLRLPA
ncbi:hypothetical protein RhiirC2_802526 [Rhizophagus irregularis]|uniref:Uncharacterized protein n=1 Tax=Rhizophagus irregularis TaxID=588596 RepID=A0A2N1M184_9GLOM|nr:hypothetical protein RhiirC2_802526 [Rhizophagus irregularis]